MKRTAWWVLIPLLCTACSNTPLLNFSLDTPPVILAPLGSTNTLDERARFREIFCGVVRDQAPRSTSDPQCDDLLHRLQGERPSTRTRNALPTAPSFHILIIPGIFGECIADIVLPFKDAQDALKTRGYEVSFAKVRGRAGSAHNAAIIRNTVMTAVASSPNARLLVIGYSKGTSDALEALAAYPELKEHIVGLVSVAGVVAGTPLADAHRGLYEHTVGRIAFKPCPIIDGLEIQSLTRQHRLGWLASHTLPDIKYFSLVALPLPHRVSSILKSSYYDLSQVDPRNDSQVIYSDAVIPGSVLLGYANADHWAVTLPFISEAPLIAATLVDKNAFPRAQLAISLVMFVEEFLHSHPTQSR